MGGILLYAVTEDVRTARASTSLMAMWHPRRSARDWAERLRLKADKT